MAVNQIPVTIKGAELLKEELQRLLIGVVEQHRNDRQFFVVFHQAARQPGKAFAALGLEFVAVA